MEGNSDFQKAAGDLGAIEVICDILKSSSNIPETTEESKKSPVKNTQPQEPMGDIIDSEDPLIFSDHELTLENKLIYYSLCGLAAITSFNEDFRKRIIEHNYHKNIMEMLKNNEPKIRSAACLCITSLARAEKSTKSALVFEGISQILYKLLFDKYLEVQQNAASALCNVALEFQKQVCENADCIKRLVELSQSKHTMLRYKAVFALKNLVFQTPTDIKKLIIGKLSYPKLFELFDDEEPTVQEQAICIMRNVMHKSKEFINEILDKAGTEPFIRKLESKLIGLNPNLVSQTIYLICNIASGSEKHKNIVMDPQIVKIVISLLVFFKKFKI